MTISLFTDLKKKKKRNNDANFQFSLAVCIEGHYGPWGCIKKTKKIRFLLINVCIRRQGEHDIYLLIFVF